MLEMNIAMLFLAEQKLYNQVLDKKYNNLFLQWKPLHNVEYGKFLLMELMKFADNARITGIVGNMSADLLVKNADCLVKDVLSALWGMRIGMGFAMKLIVI